MGTAITPLVARIMAQALKDSDHVPAQRVDALAALVDNLASQIEAHEDDVRHGNVIPLQELGEWLGVEVPGGSNILTYIKQRLERPVLRFMGVPSTPLPAAFTPAIERVGHYGGSAVIVVNHADLVRLQNVGQATEVKS